MFVLGLLASLQNRKQENSGLVSEANFANLSLSNASECLLASNSVVGKQIIEQPAEEHLFVSLTTSGYQILALITTVGLLISFVSNVIIIYLFTSTPSLRRNPSNIIAANLSISDMLYCIQWPSVIYCCLTQSTWILEYDFVCKGLGFLTVSTALVSIVTVLVMALERAIVVKYSLRAKNKITIRTAWLLVLTVWLLCLASCLPPLFGKFNRFTLDPSKTSCTLDYLTSHADYKLYILILYIAYYVSPIIAISISYSIIIITFNKSSLSLKVAGNSSKDEISGQATFLADRRKSSSLLCAKLQPPLRRLSSVASETIAACKPIRNSKLRPPPVWQIPPPASKSHQANPSRVLETLTRGPNRKWRRRAASASLASPGKCREPPTSVNTYHSTSSLLSSSQVSSPTGNQQLQCWSKLAEANKQSADWKGPPPAGCRLFEVNLGPPTNEPSRGGQIGAFSKLDSITSLQASRFMRTLSNVNSKRKRLAGTGAPLVGLRYDGSAKLASQAPAAALQQRQQSQSNWNTQAEKCNRVRNAIQLRLAKMSFYLILLWLVSWSPIAWLAMLNSIVKCRRASATAVFLAHTMTKLGPAFDVFIYGLSHPKLKSKFRLIIKRMFGLSARECK